MTTSNKHLNEFPVELGGQMSLLPKDELDEIKEKSCTDREHKQGIYSGCQLKASNREHYELICGFLAQSVPVLTIHRLTGYSRNLIYGIKNTQVTDIEHIKKELSAKLRTLSDMTVDALKERLDQLLDDPDEMKRLKMTPDKLSLPLCQLLDKLLLVEGEATQRIETIESDPGMDEFNAELEQAQGVEVSPSLAMGSDEGKLIGNRGLVGESGAVAGGDVDDYLEGGFDDESGA